MLDRFIEILEKNDKGTAMSMCQEALGNGEITIPELYENVLRPALNRLEAEEDDIEDLIWREHAMSAIVRSIIEASFPFVMQEREDKQLIINRKALVFCPAGEEHEIGARMVADFFLIQGYDVTYLGANTPEGTAKKALDRLQPDYLSISISNPYSLFTAKHLIANLRASYERSLKVVVGGSAFTGNPDAALNIGVDMLLHSYTDIEQLRLGEETVK